jgi:hypothetical protein
MSRKIRSVALLACLAASVLVGAALAGAAAAQPSQPGGPCSGPQASAQNQYCEDVPTATGGNGGRPAGTTTASAPAGTVRSALSPSIRRALAHSPRSSARRRLLDLPASLVQERLTPPQDASGLSVLLLLILILIAIVLALAALAWHRRRRGAAPAT